MKILANSILYFLIVVSETFAYTDKTGSHGKIQFSNLILLVDFGTLAVQRLLTRYIVCFKETGLVTMSVSAIKCCKPRVPLNSL